MRRGGRTGRFYSWLKVHPVEIAFSVLAAFWLSYVVHLSRGFYFWSDDLLVIQQGDAWGHLLKPYNGALSLVSMLVDHAASEVGSFSFTPFMIVGALCLVAVPLAYFFTTRRQFGPPLAAILAMPLLWFIGVSLRPAGLNHFCALLGGIICAAALNRGKRADWILAGALVFALVSAGGGLVVVGACVVHSAMARPHLRRWIAIAVPTALYGAWWLVESPSPHGKTALSWAEKFRVVRQLFLAPFHQTAFNSWPLAALLLVAFFVCGAVQLRRGLDASANFVAWTAAMIGWSVALIYSRGTADASTFRYAYLSLGFALLAVVPRKPIVWPDRFASTNARWLAIAAMIVLAFGGLRALDARRGMQKFAAQNVALGVKAKATMIVLQLGPDVVPDATPLPFYGFSNPHGTAGEARGLMARYGAPFHATTTDVDQQLVDIRAPHARLGQRATDPGCEVLDEPIDLAPTSFGEAALGKPPKGYKPGPLQYKFWASTPVAVSVRRFGDHFVQLSRIPARHYFFLTLPVLASTTPWSVEADGACRIQ